MNASGAAKQGSGDTGHAIDLQHGGLTSDAEAARERRALIVAYCGAWLFGMTMTTVYVAIFGSFDVYYAASMTLLALGLAYGLVVFNPKVPREWAIVAPMLTVVILLMMGLHLRQPGVNTFLLVPLIFATFFMWRQKKLFLTVYVLMVISYCALPLAIGGIGELRRVVIGGSIFALIGALAYLLVRRAGKLQLERSTFQSTVSSLLTALGTRDAVSRQRTLRTVELAEAVARRLGLSESDCEQVRYATYLHDIGKLGIPNELIDKSGPLSAEEWEVLREHPVIGERIVNSVPGFEDIAVIVRHEHEHWNGSGYPDGLSGDRIPIESRVIHACSTYMELTDQESAGELLRGDEIIGEMEARAGTHLDPEVVVALLEVADSHDRNRAARMLDLSLRLAG